MRVHGNSIFDGAVRIRLASDGNMDNTVATAVIEENKLTANDTIFATAIAA